MRIGPTSTSLRKPLVHTARASFPSSSYSFVLPRARFCSRSLSLRSLSSSASPRRTSIQVYTTDCAFLNIADRQYRPSSLHLIHPDFNSNCAGILLLHSTRRTQQNRLFCHTFTHLAATHTHTHTHTHTRTTMTLFVQNEGDSSARQGDRQLLVSHQ